MHRGADVQKLGIKSKFEKSSFHGHAMEDAMDKNSAYSIQ